MMALVRILAILSLVFVTACGKNKNGTAKKVASTPVATEDCMLNTMDYNGSQTCYYDYSRHSGFQNYTYGNYGFSNGLCGCQNGYAPVYNNSWGLGCVESRFGAQNSVFFTWNSMNSQWVNNQLSAPSVPSTGSCSGDAYYACDPALRNSCGSQGQCLAVGGSRLGICQYTNGYNGGYGGYWYMGGSYNYGR